VLSEELYDAEERMDKLLEAYLLAQAANRVTLTQQLISIRATIKTLRERDNPTCPSR
jgi:hypothetical protein